MGVRTNVFQVVPLGLKYRPMILCDGIMVDESRWLGTPILVIPMTLERLPFFLECKPTLHHMLVLRIPEVRKSHAELGRLSCVTRKIPAR